MVSFNITLCLDVHRDAIQLILKLLYLLRKVSNSISICLFVHVDHRLWYHKIKLFAFVVKSCPAEVNRDDFVLRVNFDIILALLSCCVEHGVALLGLLCTQLDRWNYSFTYTEVNFPFRHASEYVADLNRRFWSQWGHWKAVRLWSLHEHG